MEILVPGIDMGYRAGAAIDWSAPLVFTLADVLTAAECRDIIATTEDAGFDPAPITTARGFVMRPDVRNNTRVMFDDAPRAAELYRRIHAALPARVRDRRPVGVNERFRCYRYEHGQQFKPHYDGAFQRDPTERSELTFM